MSSVASRAQLPVGGITDPICGYAGGVSNLAVGQISRGLAVELLAGEATPGDTTPLRLRVVRKPFDEPVDDLQVEHEKLIHLIGVRDDLGEFIHLHPQRVAPGWWQVNHSFSNAGRFHFWADVKHNGRVYSFAQSPLVVGGAKEPPAVATIPKVEHFVGGYSVSLETPGELVAGKTNLFLVKIRNAEGVQIGTEFYLGALMHVVVIRDDLAIYAHGHAGNHLRGERDLYFNHVFQERGAYKIFAQFRPLKTKLPPDEALLAEFWVRVRGAAPSVLK